MFHKILAAIDGSEISHDVFKTALAIAKADHAVLVLLHVLSFEEQNSPSIPMPSSQEYFQASDSGTLDIYREQWQTYEEKGLDLLKSLSERANAAGVTTGFYQLFGSPGRKICEFAQSSGSDLIVIGHRGLSGLSELFLGSVSSYVLHRAPCSVLIEKQHPLASH
jgi:nucleotide-binding universal stress UspA family protein